MIRISSLSREYVRIAVAAETGGVPLNPTNDVVQFAFLTAATATPQTSDWQNGGWDTTALGVYVAQCLVGPGGTIALAPRTYYLWLRIIDNPETVVRQAGMVAVE